MKSWLTYILAIAFLAGLSPCLSSPNQPELVLQKGHDVAAFRLSPDGAMLATISEDETTPKLWDVSTGNLLATLVGHRTATTALAWSKRGLATAASDGVILWDIDTGEILGRLEDYEVEFLSWSSRGLVLGCADGSVLHWEPGRKPELLGSYHLPPTALSVRHQSVAAAYEDGHVSIFSLESHEEVASYSHTDIVEVLKWSPDGTKLLSASWDKTCLVWQGSDEVVPLENDIEVISATWRPDGKSLAIVGDGSAKVTFWDPLSGVLQKSVETQDGDAECVQFSPSGEEVAFGTDEDKVEIWDLSSGQTDVALTGGWPIKNLAWDTSGGRLAAGDGDCVYVWDSVSRTVLSRTVSSSNPIYDLEWDPSGRMLAVSGFEVTLWDAKSGSPSSYDDGVGLAKSVSWGPEMWLAVGYGNDKVRYLNASEGIWEKPTVDAGLATGQVDWSKDGRLIATLGTNGVDDLRELKLDRACLWHRGSRKRIDLIGHGDAVTSVVLHPSSSLVATGSDDGQVGIWRQDGSLVRFLPHRSTVTSLAWQPGSRMLATADSKGTVWLWDTDSGSVLWSANRSPGRVRDLEWNPGGTVLASASSDGQIHIWGSEGKFERSLVGGHTGPVRSLSWHPEGTVLVSGGNDGTVRYWHFESGKLLATLVMNRASLADKINSWDGVTSFRGPPDWLAVTPDGFFDGSPGGWKSVLWRIGPEIQAVAYPEQYFHDFFQPGMLGSLMDGETSIRDVLEKTGDPRSKVRGIALRDARVPQVEIGPVERLGEGYAGVPISLRTSRKGDGGIRDLRLLRNGYLVARWDGALDKGEIFAKIPLGPGLNYLKAYAFNDDGVKSDDSPVVAAINTQTPDPTTVYLLCIGVDSYDNPNLNLKFAAKDATVLSGLLEERFAVSYEVHKVVLTDKEANRARIVAELEKLSVLTKPQDIVVISFSGHGLLAEGADGLKHFVAVPSDQGPSLTPESLSAHGLSDRDLESLLSPMNAERICVILDACHSGGALESEDWRQAPLNARGLFQLAYDKRMELIAGAQSRQSALEAWKIENQEIGHGLLTFALIEGLREAPEREGQLQVRDWLDFAARRVPRILGVSDVGEKIPTLELSEPVQRDVQRPIVFHRRDGGGAWGFLSPR